MDVEYNSIMKGWFICSRIVFSDLTCSTCLSLIISFFFRIFNAMGGSSGNSLSLTSFTRPKVPVPLSNSYHKNVPRVLRTTKSSSVTPLLKAIFSLRTFAVFSKLFIEFSKSLLNLTFVLSILSLKFIHRNIAP